MKKLHALVPALLIAASAMPVMAYEAGDIIVRGGVATVNPDTDAGALVSPTALNGIEKPVTVESGHGVTITGTYLFHKNFGVEVVGALPFSHDINADGTVESLGLKKVGETKHLPPTVLAQFYPLGGTGSSIQPYVGVGVNHTIFFENDTNDAFASGVASVLGLPIVDTTLELDDSTGLGAEVGVDCMLDEHLSINASIWYLDIETTAHVDARLADGTKVYDAAKFDVAIDPLVYAIGFGYKF